MTSPPRLTVGEPAPWFFARAIGGNPRFAFHSVGGRYILLLLMGKASDPAAQSALAEVAAHRSLFDDQSLCLFGVTTDPDDETQGRLTQQLPGIRHFVDEDSQIARLYNFAHAPDRPCWVLIDPMMRIIGRFDLDAAAQAIKSAEGLIRQPSAVTAAPILIVPNVLEPPLCRALIAAYENGVPEPSGFMREVDGKTTLVTDPSHKVREDFSLNDPGMMRALATRVKARLAPMLARAFQFEVTRMERYIVACYDAGQGGHFAPHRDNTTKGTAHRRFAVTINLNADAYDGGDLTFPEFGPHRYRAPTGGAVVFSCSLLHQALPVTRGRRYAFLPFLYDEEAANIREANNAFLAPDVTPYQKQGDQLA